MSEYIGKMHKQVHLVANSATWSIYCIYLGPVVQSVVSLTSSLSVISLTVLVDLTDNILKFFC